METIKIKVSKTTEEEKEITLPLFRKRDKSAYKVFSDSKCLAVTAHEYNDPSISVCHAGLAWLLGETEDCTEAEFMEIYNIALARLTEFSLSKIEA